MTHANIFGYPLLVDNLQQWSQELERLSRLLGSLGPDEVCCEGMTTRQCGILRTLAAGEGARISELAGTAGISPSAMTRVLEKLEARQLVKRIRGAGQDGRAATVAITQQGRHVRSKIDQLMLDRTRTILSAFPSGLQPQLLAAVRLLNQALAPGGCCQIQGEEGELSFTCGLDRRPARAPEKRKKHGQH
ncbi:MAG TPA: MarR family winged helix-turn-helix transcriptional regulator [Terriglobales bacterium]|nr:MarR family winged helix-turn-helix transcriptional regulator [Terriglobales bacterium]